MDEYLEKLQTQKYKRIASQVFVFFKKHKFKSIVGLIVVIIIAGAVIKGRPVTEEAQAVLKTVEVINVSDYVSDGGQIPVVGTLEANEQIDLRPQIAGQVSAVRVSLNQQVYAGQTLVELSHRDMDAAVAQASAGLQSAQASYEKLRNGARPEDIVIAQQNLEAAKQQLLDMQNGGRTEEVAQAQNAVDLALTALDDANTNYVNTEKQNANANSSQLENAVQAIISAQLSGDQILEQDLANIYNASDDDNLIPVIKDMSLQVQANNARDEIGFKLEKWEEHLLLVDKTSKDSVLAAIDEAETELNRFLTFLSTTGNALQEALPTTSYPEASVAAAKAAVNIARLTMKGHLDGLISYRQAITNQDVLNARALEAARSQIDQAETNLKNSKEQLQIIKSGATPEQVAIQQTRVSQAEQQLLIAQNGARPEDLRLAQASIAQARASLALASANRAKAIITAPIAGTVTYLGVEIGDIASSGTIAVSIANKSGLEVDTYITDSERIFVDVGNEVTINEQYKGVVREIAPALSPVNKKIEVKVTVTDENPELTLGETVRLLIQKTAPEQAVLKLPLSAVKIKADGAAVYKVNDDNVLEYVTVEVGDVTSNTIEVLTVFEDGARLVKDARGLKEGQVVVIKG